MMKMMKKIDEYQAGDITGYYDYDKDSININVQKIWEKSFNEEKFIKEFSKTYQHEMIHKCIHDLFPRNNFTFYGEDWAVRKLMHESFPKKNRWIYEKDDSKNRKGMGRNQK